MTPDQFPPKPEKPKKAVSWLLGPQLIASLKWVALYIAFKGKLDPRDWMSAELFEFDIEHRSNMSTTADEFWFDYAADTGDAQRATYSIGYLCLCNLWADESRAGASVDFEPNGTNSVRLPRGEFLF